MWMTHSLCCSEVRDLGDSLNGKDYICQVRTSNQFSCTQSLLYQRTTGFLVKVSVIAKMLRLQNIRISL
jgi:hypothetical protein